MKFVMIVEESHSDDVIGAKEIKSKVSMKPCHNLHKYDRNPSHQIYNSKYDEE
jgi:hypothetical protein